MSERYYICDVCGKSCSSADDICDNCLDEYTTLFKENAALRKEISELKEENKQLFEMSCAQGDFANDDAAEIEKLKTRLRAYEEGIAPEEADKKYVHLIETLETFEKVSWSELDLAWLPHDTRSTRMFYPQDIKRLYPSPYRKRKANELNF